jgi:hypothetical protein
LLKLDQESDPAGASLTTVVMVAIVAEPIDAIVATVAAQRILAAKRDEAAVVAVDGDSELRVRRAAFSKRTSGSPFCVLDGDVGLLDLVLKLVLW